MTKIKTILQHHSKLALSLLFLICTPVNPAYPRPITPQIRIQVEKYKVYLTYWAANPITVTAAKQANRKNGIPGMDNSSWDRLMDNDPLVIALSQSKLARQLTKWESDKGIVKLNLRDKNGNLVAFSSHSGKPLLYNNASRLPFQNGLKGAWSDNDVKPDPTTQQETIQISVPVIDAGKTIGVLHSAVLAN
jgi:hypothetical protein